MQHPRGTGGRAPFDSGSTPPLDPCPDARPCRSRAKQTGTKESGASLFHRGCRKACRRPLDPRNRCAGEASSRPTAGRPEKTTHGDAPGIGRCDAPPARHHTPRPPPWIP
eukprot:scaffold718_cov342-Pavlova_lutheri.AAC.3